MGARPSTGGLGQLINIPDCNNWTQEVCWATEQNHFPFLYHRGSMCMYCVVHKRELETSDNMVSDFSSVAHVGCLCQGCSCTSDPYWCAVMWLNQGLGFRPGMLSLVIGILCLIEPNWDTCIPKPYWHTSAAGEKFGPCLKWGDSSQVGNWAIQYIHTGSLFESGKSMDFLFVFLRYCGLSHCCNRAEGQAPK